MSNADEEPAYVPDPDPAAMAKVQHVQDWYHSYVEANNMKVRAPVRPAPDALTARQDLCDYETMRDLRLIDARASGRSVWALTAPRYLMNLNGASAAP